MIYFYWQVKNAEHIAEHGVTTEEAEHVVLHPARGYPRGHGDDKYLVRGRTREGRYIQVIYIDLADAVELDPAELDLAALETSTAAYFVIHARPLTDAERGALKGRRKRK